MARCSSPTTPQAPSTASAIAAEAPACPGGAEALSSPARMHARASMTGATRPGPMAQKRAPTRRRRESATTSPRATAGAEAARIAAFVPRGPECAFANVRMLGRIVGAFYDEMLRPADLRAAQLALMWAIAAREPVDQKALGRITQTDQTTLSRTVENLRAAGLVRLDAGADRRTRLIRLSPQGRRAFARAL